MMAAAILTLNVLEYIYINNKSYKDISKVIEICVKLVIFLIDIYMTRVFFESLNFYNQSHINEDSLIRTSLNVDHGGGDIDAESPKIKFNFKIFYAVLVIIMHLLDSILSICAPIMDVFFDNNQRKEYIP